MKKIIIGILILLFVIGCKSDIYIEDAYISPELIKEGSNFDVLFSIVNTYKLMEGYVDYEYLFVDECIGINGSDEGRLYLKTYNGDVKQSFYTPFYVKKDIPDVCYEMQSGILLLIKNSKGVIASKKIKYDVAINTADLEMI